MARLPERDRKNHYGWYVVIDSDEAVTYAHAYRNHIERQDVETEVARHLVPGNFYGCGVSMKDALSEAFARYYRFYHPMGEGHVSPDKEAG